MSAGKKKQSVLSQERLPLPKMGKRSRRTWAMAEAMAESGRPRFNHDLGLTGGILPLPGEDGRERLRSLRL